MKGVFWPHYCCPSLALGLQEPLPARNGFAVLHVVPAVPVQPVSLWLLPLASATGPLMERHADVEMRHE
ncbi:hypothetical protein SAMN05880593_12485 [Rhizobium sp. RU36D]|nr:hypothetical protein SAMN05880593_12485 [Rhizobium sp. RU36D]